ALATVEAAAAARPEPLPAGGRYTVQPGETLFSIARRFGLSAPELAAWNDLADPNLLANGQEISLLAPAAAAPTAAPPTAAPAPAAAPQAPPPAAANGGQV